MGSSLSTRPVDVSAVVNVKDTRGVGVFANPERGGSHAASVALGVRGVIEVRQEMSRWDVENPRAAPSPD
jgi:hypothetical protein